MTETQAERDAHTAWTYAINVVLLEDKGGLPGRSMPEVFDDYATDLLKQLGGDHERCIAAARSACIAAAEHVDAPGLWRPGLRAVELCQRAAHLASHPEESALKAPRVLAEGEDEVIAFLESAGIPDFGIDAMLQGADAAPGSGWPWGSRVEEASDENTVVTVTRRDDGVYRVESGPAEEFDSFDEQDA